MAPAPSPIQITDRTLKIEHSKTMKWIKYEVVVIYESDVQYIYLNPFYDCDEISQYRDNKNFELELELYLILASVQVVKFV